MTVGHGGWWDRSFARDRKIHGGSNVWSGAQGGKKIYGFDVHAGFEGNHRSVAYGKQCLLVWSCVKDRGRSHLKKGIGRHG